MSILRRVSLATLLCIGLAGNSYAQDISGQQMKSLDGQVQEIKADVLAIASELNNLEERLLYPSNTQIAVFVSVAPNDSFRLDSVQIEIDGQMATHHIYSFKARGVAERRRAACLYGQRRHRRP